MLTATNGPITGFQVGAGNLPPGLTLSNSGTISGTPTTAGTYTSYITATNANGTGSPTTMTITVVLPPPPTANGQSLSTALWDRAFNHPDGRTDPSNLPLTYSVVAGPAHGNLRGTALSVTYTPASGYSGTDSFTFKANNGYLDSNVATISIAVGAPPLTLTPNKFATAIQPTSATTRM